MSFDEIEQNKSMQSLTKEEKVAKENNEYPSNKPPLPKNHLIKVNKVVTTGSSTIDFRSVIHLTQIGAEKDKNMKNKVDNIDENYQNEQNYNNISPPIESLKHH